MAYTKTQWVNNTTPINDTNLNKIEQGIYDNSLVVDAVTNTINPTDTETYKTAELTEGQITDVIGVNDILIKGQTSQNGEPTPSSPVDVNVVSGSNQIILSNGNVVSLEDGEYTSNNVNVVVQKGKLKINGKSTSTPNVIALNLSRPIEIKANQKFTLSCNNPAGIGTNTDYFAIRLRANVNGTSIDNYFQVECTSANAKKTVQINEDITITNILVRTNSNIMLSNYILEPQITIDSNVDTYIPHQSKKLPLDLGSIELCKIGNYQDYFYKSGSKWYLHKEIGKTIINGSEAGWAYPSDNRFNLDNLNIKYKKQSGKILHICNKYKAYNQTESNGDFNNLVQNVDYGFNLSTYTPSSGTAYTARFKDTRFTNVTDFKTWLASNNIILYCVLETSTNTEITDTTLISQLEEIYNAPLYEETNITQENNDLPMILNITACKDNINGIKAFIRK